MLMREKNIQKIFLSTILLCVSFTTLATDDKTTRIPEFSNNEVNVWKTIIYPSKNQILKMHRYEYNRVIVALDTGILKITNNQGKTHHLNLEKDHSYYLTKEVPGELHTDENISSHPIRVLVIELKK